MGRILFCFCKLVANNPQTLPYQRDVARSVANKEYVLQKISDLQNRYPFLEWKRFFSFLSGNEVASDAAVQVYFPGHFERIFKTLAAAPISELHDSFLAVYLSDLYYNFIQTRRDGRGCQEISSSFFHDVVSSLQIDGYGRKFLNESDQLLHSVFDLLKGQFVKSIEESDIMSDADKASSVDKIKILKLVLGGEFGPGDVQQLEEKYRKVGLQAGDYQTNYVKMLNFARSNYLALRGAEFKEEDFYSRLLLPSEEEPLTLYTSRFIAAPYGLLRKLPKKLPGYVVMARLGFHLGKAIGTHFDPTGIKYGLDWSEGLKEKYEIMVSKTNVYMSDKRKVLFEGRHVEFQIPIEYSTNRRIADNIAFRLASDLFDKYGNQALLPWISSTYTKEQIFYILVAQEYCRRRDLLEEMEEMFEGDTLPPFLLIENVMSNSRTFSESGFDCALGSGMNNNDDQKNQFPYIRIEDEYGENNEDVYRS